MSPAEIEDRLLEHPSVSYAAVVAAPDRDGLQKPVAFVLLGPGQTATEDEVIEFCRAGLPSVKRPRRVVFVDSYPSTASGKIRRVELRQMAAAVLQPAAEASA
jgi:acyl-coenzyme A synthetase/AMP-(fatty) acid ligase